MVYLIKAGLDIPPILTDLDEKTGLPKILNIKVSFTFLFMDESEMEESIK